MSFKLQATTPSNDKNSTDLQQFNRQVVEIEDLLIWCSTQDASDLYIKEGSKPYISRFGQIFEVPCVETTRIEWGHFYDAYITNERNAEYVREKMLDTSIDVRIPEGNIYYEQYPGQSFRYRVSLGFSENHNIATFRMIRPEPPTFETINYPEICRNSLYKAYGEKTGIVLFTGATGSGKQLHKDTMIPTLHGMKKMQDINIGDIIFDKNGEPTTVIDKYSPYETNFYEFTFSDGTRVKSGGGHLWEVEFLNKVKSYNHKYYTGFFTGQTINYLKSLNDTEITFNDFSKNLVDNSDFSFEQTNMFIRKYFYDTLYHKNTPYIDLEKIINISTYSNVKKRVNKINNFMQTHNRKFATNKEAHELLGSKFIHLIRKSKQKFYSESIIYTNNKKLADEILNWKYSIEDAINNPRPIEIVSSNDIAMIGVRNVKNRLNFAIRRPKPAKFNNIDLPIEPYWLGAWLGDGNKWDTRICGVDLEIGNKLSSCYNMTYAKTSEPRKEGYMPLTTWGFGKDVAKKLEENNLIGNKHIPNKYKISSIENKLELLAGLIDTDGSVGDDGSCGIGMINKQIIYSIPKYNVYERNKKLNDFILL